MDGRQPNGVVRWLLCSILTVVCVATVSMSLAAPGDFIDVFVAPGSGGLGIPEGIVFGPDGNLYVSSQSNDRVLRYDGTTGAFIDTFVSAGSGGLNNPKGLVFGPDGNLYVTSVDTDEVLRYNGATGAFIDAFVSAGSGGLNNWGFLVFGPDGNLYVSSTNGILRYNGATGAFIDAFVSAGSGGLSGPAGARFGLDGSFYVASNNTKEVLRYNGITGAFIDTFVSAASGGLNEALGLVFGPDDNLYVTSFFTPAEVLRYDGATGAFIDVFVSPGSGGLGAPWTQVFGADGNLYVCSTNGPPQILRYEGPPPIGPGPIILGGDDLDDHGSSDGVNNFTGWLYIEGALTDLSANLTAGCNGNDGTVAVLGATDSAVLASNGGAAARSAVDNVPGLTPTFHDTAAGISTFFTDLGNGAVNPAIIYIPTGDNWGHVFNGLQTDEDNVLTANKAAIADFVNGGCGLLAHSHSYGWLDALEPLVVLDPGACQSPTLSLTLAGQTAFPSLSNADLSGGPCHASFSGDLSDLDVFATDPLSRNAIIGTCGLDPDGDNIGNYCDRCPDIFDPAQSDCDMDGVGDACDPDTVDGDLDGVDDACDNCPSDANPAQEDCDMDGVGDACEPDGDSDGIPDDCDNCPLDFNLTQTDTDDDGVGDVCDPCPADPLNDIDADGFCADVDNCPGTANPDQQDTDGDGVGDVCDPCMGIFNGPEGRFGQTVLASANQGASTFEWPNATDWRLARGTFVSSSDIGNLVADLSSTGSGASVLDANTPAPGDGFWYLIQPDCPGGTYDIDSPSQVGSREVVEVGILQIIGPSDGLTGGPSSGLDVDAAGNVYVSGGFSQNAFKVAPDGTITQILDSTGDGLGNVHLGEGDLAVDDGNGNVYVASLFTDTVFRITPGGTVTQIADGTGDGVNALDFAQAVAVDAAGNVYVAGGLSDNVFKIATPTTCSTTGTPCTITEVIDGSSGVSYPAGLAVDGAGNVYVQSVDNNRAFKIVAPGTCSTAGTPCTITMIISSSGDGVHPLQGGGGNIAGIAVDDSTGDVYVSGILSDNVFKIDAPGTCSVTGTPCTITEIIDASGDGSNALDFPRGLAADAGVVYLAGRGGNNGFEIVVSASCSTTGTPCAITEIIDASGDGVNGLNAPQRVALADSGEVYVSAQGSSNVFRILP